MIPEDLIQEAERILNHGLADSHENRAGVTLEYAIQLSQAYALIAIAKKLSLMVGYPNRD